MKNQYQGLKISSTLYNSIIFCSIFFGIIVLFFIADSTHVFAEVFIPQNEYLAYFDSQEIYTVVGNVKNENNFGIIPTITVSVLDDKTIFSKTIKHVPLGPKEEIPFKIKFPEILGKTPKLIPAEISFKEINKRETKIDILYDETLVKNPDGSLTGRFQNTGETTIFFPKIFAVVHGYEKVLDIVQNIEYIEKIEPGEIKEFSMFPDPSVLDDVFYYSCFAPVDTTVVPITTKKDGGDFDFRYDSGAWYYGAKFNEKGDTLTIRGYNSYPLETYANFEFPPISGNEDFDVTINDKPIDFIQSIDEMGYWHVAFTVDPTSQGVVKISGFEKGLPEKLPKVPEWIKLSADWWTTGQISDIEFLEGIDFLFEKGIIFVAGKEITTESNWKIPSWYQEPVSWWFEDKISDDDFLNSIENLVERKIIII